MKKDIAAQEIKNLIEVIKEQQDLVLSHDGIIPQIEMDILMGNVRKLYESLIHLNKINASPATEIEIKADDEKLIATTEIVALESKVYSQETVDNHSRQSAAAAATPTPSSESVAPEPEVIHQESTSNNSEQAPAAAAVPTPASELVASESEVIIQQSISNNSEQAPAAAATPTLQLNLATERTKEFTKPVQKNPMPATLFDDTPTVSGKYTASPTLYDKIASTKEDKSIATKLQKNPVTDLKKSIGINEKFAFINELFDGDLNAYNKAVEQLNGSVNHGDAVTLLENEFAVNLGWSTEAESYIKLRNLIDRRFTS